MVPVNKPRVLITTHYWPPHVGGIETVAVEHARRLSERGWDVMVATSRLAGDRSSEQHGRVLVERFRCFNGAESALNIPVPLMSPTMLCNLWKRASEVDVIVAHGHVYVGTLYAALAARRFGKPFVLVQHSPFVDYGLVRNLLERVADRAIGSRVIRSAHSVIAVSEFTATFVRSLVPEVPIVILRSAIDSDRFSANEEGPKRQRPVVFTVRRLVPRNGVDLLVEAWRLGGLSERADLVIGGAGPQMAHIRGLAAGDTSIRLIGHIPAEELPTRYRDADIFVLPSRSGEGFGLVVLEAMASGLAVIATTSGGVTDIVTDGVNGRLVPPNDVSALSDALCELVDDAVLRAELRKGALDSVRSSSWDVAIDLLEETLAKATSP
jgi:D-inositol-3-phosphate glycosyltransferase